MTMHLVKGLSSTPSKKSKPKKLTKEKLAKLTADHKAFNKDLRQQHRHKEQLTFDEYVDRLYGKPKEVKKKSEFKELEASKPDYRKTPYNPIDARSTSVAAKKDTKVYTGSLVKGIAQTHKSNAVPVLGKDDATEIANMRRN